MRWRRSPIRFLAAAATFAALPLALAANAVAATPPIAFTGPVSAVGPSSATLGGTVNPSGAATSWQFEYGATTAYGTKTAATSVGSGTANIDVSSSLTGLLPGTVYHYRLDATNSSGTTFGGDGLFTTSAAATGPVTGAATNLTQTTAILNGTVTVSGTGTTFWFEIGSSTAYGTKTAETSAGTRTGAVAVSAPVSGLQPGRTYHFRVVTLSNGITTPGADATFTTAGAAATGRPTVTTSAASSVTVTSARLNGRVTPNGQATTWYFDFGTSTAYGSHTPAASVGSGTQPTAVSATVNGLPTGLYHFRLVATNASGTTYGSDMTFGSGAPIVQTGTAQAASATTATLTGSVNPVGNATTWSFQYGTTTAYGSTTALKSAGTGTAATGVAAAITNLAAGTTYHYRLVATSGAGTTDGSDVTFSTTPAVTLTAAHPQTVFRSAVAVSGLTANGQSGIAVTIEAKAYGASSFTALGTVTSGAAGRWAFTVNPTIMTTYQASTAGGTSAPVSIGVAPAISLRLITGGRLAAHVGAPVSYVGKSVTLQRLASGGLWTTVAHGRLSARSTAVFSLSDLPLGSSTVRVAMSVNQAGAGYLAGFSAARSVKRR